MNRLIIIGNGFDLAHGLKTSFNDFIIDFFCDIWPNLGLDKFENRLLELNHTTKFHSDRIHSFSTENCLNIFSAIHKDRSTYFNEPSMIIKSDFFKSVFKRLCQYRWADIELEYYNELIHIIENENLQRANTNNRIEIEDSIQRRVKSLNDDLDFLEGRLIVYLKKQETYFQENPKIDSRISDCFHEKINSDPVYESEPKEVQFLNFNYTNILSKYTDNSNILFKYTDNSNIIHIHGTLDDNPIFGFGDDTSNHYRVLEDSYNNEVLKKIKSFKYPQNSNYKKLMSFIERDEFEVQIYGHSCGVSDRTLFKKIFEHEKCKSIKIFYYNKEDFNEKMYEISRHFGDKTMFLDKIISFDKLRAMPQPTEIQ